MPTTATSSKKRKADASSSGTSKKARVSTAAKELVASIVSDPSGYAFPEDEEDARGALVELARYARSLEEQIQSTVKSPEKIQADAEKLSSAINKGIRKQMTVNCIPFLI